MVVPTSEDERPNVLFADNCYMSDEALQRLEGRGRIVWGDCASEDEFVELVGRVNPKVIISEYFKITGRIMEGSKALRGIVVWGIGYDHVDLESASERGIYIANTRGSNSESVAEHAFSLILGLSRKILQSDTFIRGGGWLCRQETGLPRDLMAHDLCEKTLGVIGLGAIGARVSGIGRALNMRVIAHDPYLSFDLIRERGAEPVELNTLLKESDFVTLHVVLNDETEKMIGERELEMMKASAYLINTSRGAIVDQEALIRAIREKKIAGAGLDVFSKEPVSAVNPLLKFDNVIVTPHCAGNSKEALTATSQMVSEEALKILANQLPANLVNRSQFKLGDE